MASYDRADWHYGGNFPKDLPNENGGTHIGMFLAWSIHNGLVGDFHIEESQEDVNSVKERKMTGRDFLFKACDEKFWEEDLSEEGNEFAKAYYSGSGDSSYGLYVSDYETTLAGGLATIYHVEDSWENYEKIEKIISRRYSNWRTHGSVEDPPKPKKPWWKVW